MSAGPKIKALATLFEKRRVAEAELAACDAAIERALGADSHEAKAPPRIEANDHDARPFVFPARGKGRPLGLIDRVAKSLGTDSSHICKVANGHADTLYIQKALTEELRRWSLLSDDEKKAYSRHLSDRDFAKRFAEESVGLPVGQIISAVAQELRIRQGHCRRVASGVQSSIEIQAALLAAVAQAKKESAA